jgi:hypothetical protein
MAVPIHIVGLGLMHVVVGCLKLARFIEGENNTIFAGYGDDEDNKDE